MYENKIHQKIYIKSKKKNLLQFRNDNLLPHTPCG